MWTTAALLQGEPTGDHVKVALDIGKDGTRSEALRAVGAYFVGRHGDHGRRTELKAAYAHMPPYAQSAAYASSRFWKNTEKSTANSMWAGHGPLHALIAEALKA